MEYQQVRERTRSSSADLRYYPIRTPNGILGVIGIGVNEVDDITRLDRERIIQSFMNQAGLAIERIQLSERLSKALM